MATKYASRIHALTCTSNDCITNNDGFISLFFVQFGRPFIGKINLDGSEVWDRLHAYCGGFGCSDKPLTYLPMFWYPFHVLWVFVLLHSYSPSVSSWVASLDRRGPTRFSPASWTESRLQAIGATRCLASSAIGNGDSTSLARTPTGRRCNEGSLIACERWAKPKRSAGDSSRSTHECTVYTSTDDEHPLTSFFLSPTGTHLLYQTAPAIGFVALFLLN